MGVEGICGGGVPLLDSASVEQAMMVKNDADFAQCASTISHMMVSGSAGREALYGVQAPAWREFFSHLDALPQDQEFAVDAWQENGPASFASHLEAQSGAEVQIQAMASLANTPASFVADTGMALAAPTQAEALGIAFSPEKALNVIRRMVIDTVPSYDSWAVEDKVLMTDCKRYVMPQPLPFSLATALGDWQGSVKSFSEAIRAASRLDGLLPAIVNASMGYEGEADLDERRTTGTYTPEPALALFKTAMLLGSIDARKALGPAFRQAAEHVSQSHDRAWHLNPPLKRAGDAPDLPLAAMAHMLDAPARPYRNPFHVGSAAHHELKRAVEIVIDTARRYQGAKSSEAHEPHEEAAFEAARPLGKDSVLSDRLAFDSWMDVGRSLVKLNQAPSSFNKAVNALSDRQIQDVFHVALAGQFETASSAETPPPSPAVVRGIAVAAYDAGDALSCMRLGLNLSIVLKEHADVPAGLDALAYALEIEGLRREQNAVDAKRWFNDHTQAF